MLIDETDRHADIAGNPRRGRARHEAVRRIGTGQQKFPREDVGIALAEFLGAVGLHTPESERRVLLRRAWIRVAGRHRRIVRRFDPEMPELVRLYVGSHLRLKVRGDVDRGFFAAAAERTVAAAEQRILW